LLASACCCILPQRALLGLDQSTTNEDASTWVQAMADYATLIWELKEDLDDPALPVIGFGG
jgi:hypothetical protein